MRDGELLDIDTDGDCAYKPFYKDTFTQAAYLDLDVWQKRATALNITK